MVSSIAAPERARILRTIGDYFEQLREEGMDGLPAPAAVAGAGRSNDAIAAPSEPGTKPAPSPAPAPRGAASAVAKQPVRELFGRYPGLEGTASLEELRQFIGDCTRCKLHRSRTHLVFGVGNPKAELMFVGEGPGAEEDARGEPFVGRAGQLLTDIIERGMGMARSQVYICNVIKCRPPENRNPEPDEVAACEPFLMRQIDLVRPKVIVALGAVAVQALLGVKTPIGKLRGVWQEVRGIKTMPTFHPAYLLRNPNDKRLVWQDIREVMKALGRPVAKRGGPP